MKVSAVIFLCVVAVTVAVAIPVQPDINTNSQLTLADIENEQNAQNYVEGVTDDNSPAAREKRFILKKIALYKLGKLTFGALGLAGAALATKGVLNTVLHFPSHHSFASPRLSVSYPNGAYYRTQYY